MKIRTFWNHEIGLITDKRYISLVIGSCAVSVEFFRRTGNILKIFVLSLDVIK